MRVRPRIPDRTLLRVRHTSSLVLIHLVSHHEDRICCRSFPTVISGYCSGDGKIRTYEARCKCAYLLSRKVVSATHPHLQMRGLPLSKTYLKAFTFGNFPYMKQAQIRYFHNANSLASFTFLGLNYRVTVAHTAIMWDLHPPDCLFSRI